MAGRSMIRLRRCLALLASLLLALGVAGSPARADVFNLGEYHFTAGAEPGQYELTASLPETQLDRQQPTWPEGCDQTAASRSTLGGRAQLSYEISCAAPVARGDTIQTPWRVDGATFRSNATGVNVSMALSPDENGVTLPIGENVVRERALIDVAGEFTWQGILHILGGWDHLAFVLCLCLLTRGRTLLILVTTFTIGHSLSLALAFFEVVQVPVPPVEAVIALSIAFMAREALRAKQVGGEDMQTVRRYMVVVSAFGLLHGLGFATVLGELGVAPGERLPGLLFFNLGVEIGQLLFVGFVTGVMWVATRLGRGEPVRLTALYAAGAIGSFWMFERVVGFTLLAG